MKIILFLIILIKHKKKKVKEKYQNNETKNSFKISLY